MIYAVNKRTKEHRDVTEEYRRLGFVAEDWCIVQATPDGWIEHDGKGRPLPPSSHVSIRMKSGYETAGAALEYRWAHAAHIGKDGDIIAYRPILDADTKPEPAWNGEGLPPAGCECEYLYSEGSSWRKGICVGHHNAKAVVVDLEDEGAECCPPSRLRPIRSEEDRAKTKAVDALIRALSFDRLDSEEIYNAIRDGKVPGVKLEGA